MSTTSSQPLLVPMMAEESTSIALFDAGTLNDGEHGLDGILGGNGSLEVWRVLSELSTNRLHDFQLLFRGYIWLVVL